MEAPSRTLLRKRSKRFKCISIGAILLVLVIIAIVVPLAVILPKQNASKGKSSIVLLPLYIYPDPGAWDPLYQAITSHPNVDFTVVINPDSGPGNTSQYPNEAYTSGIQKLNAYQNVKTIGYVRTGYAIRDPNEVLLDISIYSGWAQHPNKSDIAMHGIFFDEVVYEYSEGNANYLKLINQAAKNASGLLSDKLIVHNPGVVPDSRLQEPNTDVTVVFEQSYQKYSNLKTSLNDLSNNRTEYSYIVHSLPQDMGKGKLKSYVNDLSKRAKYLFVTDSNQGYYEKFGENWATFLDVFPS